MAPQKKKKQSSNKKKNKGGGGGARNNPSSSSSCAASPAVAQGNENNHNNHINLASSTSSWNSSPKAQQQGANKHVKNDSTTASSSYNNGGIYQTYKQATMEFRNGLSLLLPNAKLESVQDLQRASDHILNSCIVIWEHVVSQTLSPNDVAAATASETETERLILLPELKVPPRPLMESLNTSIANRENVMNRFLANHQGDEGHRHMLSTLKYCRKVLKLSRMIAKDIRSALWAREKTCTSHTDDAATSSQEPTSGNDDDDVMDMIGGRFNALLLEEELEDKDDDDDEEEEKGGEQAIDLQKRMEERNFRVEAPEPASRDYSIDELIHADDRFQCMAFLTTMDSLMCVVDSHYQNLKDYLRGAPSMSLHSSDTNLQLFLECAVAANMSMECVETAFSCLSLDHGHIRNFYDVLAIVFGFETIAEIGNLLSCHNNNDTSAKVDARSRVRPHYVKQFVGDIMEASFHNRPHELLDPVVAKYLSLLGIRNNKSLCSQIHQIAKVFQFGVMTEILFRYEELGSGGWINLIRSSGLSSHSWLASSCQYIGKGRCILNTQALLQRIFDCCKDFSVKLLPARNNFFGSVWDENGNPARQIRGDMDQFVAQELIPDLVAICCGPRCMLDFVPTGKELMPLLNMLRRHIQKGPKEAMPIGITFGVHAILTSILVLQGNHDVQNLCSGAKESYEKLFAQLEEASAMEYPIHPAFRTNVDRFKSMAYLPRPIKHAATPTSEMNALWNPVVGGGFLLFGINICSIYLGSACVDAFGQLRLVMHLYHALRERNLVGEIDMLRGLEAAFPFQSCKALWVAGRPERGSFVKHFWLAWGCSMKEAARMQEQALQRSRLKQSHFEKETRPRPHKMVRDLNEILPEQMSASYRILVNHDFSQAEKNVIDYTIEDIKDKAKALKESKYINCLVRINQARDAMDDDETDIIPVNFPLVGAKLNAFCEELSAHLGWALWIAHEVQRCPDSVRNDRTLGGSRATAFTTCDENMNRQALAHCWATLLAELDYDNDGEESSLNGEFSTSRKAAAFMTEYFANITRDQYTFLVY
ncbi:hypothetical protein ACA910_019507 [Epithemia clementina (nom. ined.)]